MPTTVSSRSKAKAKAASKTKGSPLDSRQRELLEAQSKVEAEIAALKQALSEGPRRAAAQRQQSAREYAAQANRPQQFRHSAIVADNRFADTPIVRRTKSKPQMRRERRAAQMQFLALMVVLVAALCWAAHLLMAYL